jgi:uncharacterized protein YbjT (DUF2867 family)
MGSTNVIAVLGSTGAQGGSLCDAIIADPEGRFTCRAITRTPGSDRARALESRGVEVVAADLDDEASLIRAFAGAHGVFGVTSYPEIFRAEGDNAVQREQRQAVNIARAAKAVAARHVIWSTLDDTTQWLPLSDPRMPTLMGRYKVPHTDSKGQIDHVFSDLGLPVTFLLTCFYWDNFYKYGWGPKRAADGSHALTFAMGNARMPGIAIEDIGRCAYSIFLRRSDFIGKKVGIAGEHLSGYEMADKCSTALGIACRYNPISPEAYRNQGFPAADDLGNMFQIFDEFEPQYRASRSVEVARDLVPSLLNFDQWITKYKNRIPLG